MNEQSRKCTFACWLVTASLLLGTVLAIMNLTGLFAGSGLEAASKIQESTIEETSHLAKNAISQDSSRTPKMDAGQNNPWPPKEYAEIKNKSEPANQSVNSTEPTEKQTQDFRLLEQKANGQIQVIGPLLPEIMTSQEFHSLTEAQRRSIINRLITRMNNGELTPEDVYPRGDS